MNFYHRTNNIVPVLKSGRVLSLKHLARQNPDLDISVEPEAGGSNIGGIQSKRKTLTALDAYSSMKDVKDVDSVFLTKDTILPESSNYGKYIIEKKLTSPRFNEKINLIANEYFHRRPISVKSRASVYVPDDEHEVLRDEHPGIDIRPLSSLKARTSGLYDIARTLIQKTTGLGKQADINTLFSGSEKDIQRILSPNATIVGSEGIGISLDGTSDRDILVPYSTRAGYDRLVKKLDTDGLGLSESEYNYRKRDGFKVYTYKHNDIDLDVALVHGGKAKDLANHVRYLRSNLSDESKSKIIDNKRNLQDAWFFKDTRYKRYKRGLDKKLGLTKFHE